MREEIVIAGGGLAGLSLAWFLAEAGRSVLVIESKNYPRARVCGEYLSLESLPLLERMGVALPPDSPFVSALAIHAAGKKEPVRSVLPLGAIGISRYYLDDALHQACLKSGVRFLLNSRVLSIENESDGFRIKTQNEAVEAARFINATGKSPSLQNSPPERKARYLASKFHVEDAASDPAISLLQYPGGYCGTSRVEGGLRCVCYLVRQDVLDRHKNLEGVERYILQANPVLKPYLPTQSERLRPVAISNFAFGETGVENAIGDARYLVPPLTGNGMSLALRDGYRKAMEMLGKPAPPFQPNPAAELVQRAAESNLFGALHTLMRAKSLLNQIVESTFGPII